MLSKLTASSIRVRLLFVVLFAALPASLLVLDSGLKQRRLARELAEQKVLGVARLAASRQQQVVEGARHLLIALVQLPAVQDGTEAERSELLARLMKGFPDYANIGMVAMNGDNIASAFPKRGPVNVSDLAYFRRAVATQDFAIGDYQMGKITGRPSINVAHPLRDAQGRMTAMVFAALGLDWLNKVVAQAELPAESVLVVFDDDARILAHHPDGVRMVGKVLSADDRIRSLIAGNDETTAVWKGVDGVERLYAATPLVKTKSGTPAHVAVGMPLGVVYAQATRELERNVMLLALATCAAALASWMVGRYLISRPIKRLAEATRRLAAGDLGARAGASADGDEISRLGRAFDEMAKSLQEGTKERARARDALHESEERLRVALAAGRMGTFRTDLERGVIFLDARLRELHGFDASRGVIPLPEAMERIHPEDRGLLREAMERTARDGESDYIEFRVVLPDGAVRWLCGAARVAGAGQIVGVHFDITERKEAEAQLRDVVRYSRTIIMHATVEAPEGWDRHEPEWTAGRYIWDITVDDEASAREIMPVVTEAGGSFTIAWFRSRLPGEPARLDMNAARAFVSGAPSYSQEYRCMDGTGRVHHFLETVAIQPTGHGRWKAVIFNTDITERKEAELALRESEELLRAVSEGTADPIYAKDLEGRLLFANPATLRVLGRTAAEVIGRTDAEFLANPDTARALMANDRRIMDAGRAEVVEESVDTPEGTRVFLSSKSPRRDGTGRVTGLIGVSRDITEREEAGRQLREVLRHARTITMHAIVTAPEGYAEHEPEWSAGRYLYEGVFENEEAVREVLPLDVPPGGSFYDSWVTNRHPDDKPQMSINAARALVGGESHYKNLFRVRDGEGRWHWFAQTTLVQPAGSGRWKITAINTDITELKEAEQALRENEERLRLALHASHAGVWERNLQTGAATWSPECMELYGFEPAGEVPSHEGWKQLLYPDDREAAGKAFRDAVEGRAKEFHAEFRVMHPRLGERWLFGIGRVLRADDGTALRISGINLDITGRKEAEERLREAKEAAEVASRLKGEFLANMSHEIRTPMHALIGILNLLIHDEPTEERRASLALAKSSASSLLKLLEEILSFSKLESGKAPHRDVHFSLDACIKDSVHILAGEAAARGLALTATVAPGVPDLLLGDDVRLGQVLANLVSNSIKFTPQGEIAVRVTIEEQTPGSVLLRFAVSDTGIGIPAAHLHGIFEAFTQVDPSSTRAYGGVGLGLAITRRLVDALGGRIWVDSQPGKGSTFYFTARFVPGDEIAEA